jgi:hypothetical protein
MKRFDQNDVIGWLIMAPLIVLIWALGGYLISVIVVSMF